MIFLSFLTLCLFRGWTSLDFDMTPAPVFLLILSAVEFFIEISMLWRLL